MSEWLQWDLKGSCRVQIPADARTRLEDDGATAVIQLGTGEDITEVLLSNFPLKKPTQDRTELAIELRDHAIGFFNHAVAKAVGHAVPINVEVTEEPDQKLYYAQGVAVIDK